MARVLHFGQVIIDFTLLIDALPESGGDVFASDSGVHAGGGYNVLYAAKQMGADAVYAGAVGEGPMAQLALKALDEIGIVFCGARVPSMDTGICVAMTDSSGERTFVSTRGAETHVPHDFYENLEVADDDVVYLSGYSFAHTDNRIALERFARAHAGRSGFTLFDVGPMVGSIEQSSLDAVANLNPLWSLNERESAILCGRLAVSASDDLAERCTNLAQALSARVLLRAGGQGAWLSEGAVYIPTPTVSVVDTNGAGDAHAGVLCAVMLEGMSLEKALKLANCAGALSTQKFGPATCPSRAEFEEAYRAL